jgi:lipoate-protein ligase A
MKIYLSKENDVFKNIALDEALLFHEDIKEDILFISQSKRTIIIGRNQDIYKIINHDFIEKKGITITRRLSGGGAIYQDPGTVSFSFVTKKSSRLLGEVLKPIINFLHNIGLDAKVKDDKNIYVDDKKISLITQYHYNGNVLYHGVLLFNSDLKMLIKALTREDHIHQTRLTDHEDNSIINIKELLKTN